MTSKRADFARACMGVVLALSVPLALIRAEDASPVDDLVGDNESRVSDASHGTEGQLEHGYVQNGDVKIHYVTAGEGPLVVMLHGFPDYWYTWRNQIPEIAKSHQVVAIDLRGFNRSGQPDGVEKYAMPELVGDVKAVIDHFQQDQAIVVGHDWGGMIAWSFAMQHPQMMDRLVILNLPHPAGLSRELANNPAQQAASEYARQFQKPDAASKVTAEGLTFWVTDGEARKKYVEAMKRSSLEGMLNYYKANFPRQPYTAQRVFPKVTCRVLMIHGLDDNALLADALNGTWDHLDQPFTLVTVPGAGHFVQQDAPALVTKTIVNWLEDN
ncbi:MAG: alpha/beta hydrolase [Planctomycetota bacterium]